MLATTVQGLVGAWATFYQDSTPAQVGVQFLHVGGIVGAGGLAIASDRDVLRLARAESSERVVQLERQRRTHGVILAGLAIVVLSGVAFLLADLDTFLESVPFWIKMGLVALLIANGAWMVRLERRLLADPAHDRDWGRLRVAALASIVLWFLTTLLGTVLTNAA